MHSQRKRKAELVSAQFAKNLRHFRKERGLSQEALAELSDIHRTEASLLERGEREPGLGTLVKLAGALQVSVADLTEGIEWWPIERAAPSGGFFSSEKY